MELILYDNVKPASFNNGVQRQTQTDLIVSMIVTCIKEDRMITIDDILDCWFKAPHRHSIRYWDESGYRYFDPYEKDKILAHCKHKAEERARIWFMSNLGAAIVKGKLLVIPVIDIEKLEDKQLK